MLLYLLCRRLVFRRFEGQLLSLKYKFYFYAFITYTKSLLQIIREDDVEDVA